MTLDQKPESLNLSSFYYDLLQLKSKFSDINSGMGGTLILKNASISYPSITFWKSMINNLESNLDADIESGMSIPLQWVDIPKIFNNNTSLTAGFPANVYSLYSSLYNSEKNLDLLSSGGESLLKNLNIQTRHSSLQDYHFLCLFNAIHEVFRSVNETEYLLAEISSLRILGEIRDDPINFSIVNKENVQKNELRAHSDSKISTHTFNPLTLESIRTQPEIKPPIYTDSILTHSITSEVQNNMGNFLEDLLSSENSEPTSCKRYGDHFYLEYQLFYPRRNDFGKLETVPGPSGTIDLNKGFEASTYKNDGRPISSQDLILPDTFFSLLLMQGNLTLGKDYPSPILRTTYYKGNFPLYSNLTNIHIFNISSFNSDKEISENNNETLSIENLHNLGINPPFSQTENMKITSFTITHPILIPKEISMTLDWLQKIPNSVSQFSVFEVSGTNSLRLNSLEFVEPSELFQDILKRTVFLDDGFVTGDIIGIKLEFESLNLVLRGLNSLQLNEKCILNYTLREDTGDGPIKTNYTREISISIVIYPPLSYDDPLVGKGALISLSIIIAFFAIIMILRIRKRHWNTPLMDVIKRMKRKRNFLKD